MEQRFVIVTTTNDDDGNRSVHRVLATMAGVIDHAQHNWLGGGWEDFLRPTLAAKGVGDVYAGPSYMRGGMHCYDRIAVMGDLSELAEAAHNVHRIAITASGRVFG